MSNILKLKESSMCASVAGPHGPQIQNTSERGEPGQEGEAVAKAAWKRERGLLSTRGYCWPLYSRLKRGDEEKGRRRRGNKFVNGRTSVNKSDPLQQRIDRLCRHPGVHAAERSWGEPCSRKWNSRRREAEHSSGII